MNFYQAAAFKKRALRMLMLFQTIGQNSTVLIDDSNRDDGTFDIDNLLVEFEKVGDSDSARLLHKTEEGYYTIRYGIKMHDGDGYLFLSSGRYGETFQPVAVLRNFDLSLIPDW